VVIALAVEPEVGVFYTTGPFMIGALTSIVSGYIAMQIAVRANVRTAKQAQSSLACAFDVAFRGGIVLGFVLVGLGLLILHLLIVFYLHKR
jgi:Na+/H+-translocating membrane pyrophosphatase